VDRRAFLTLLAAPSIAARGVRAIAAQRSVEIAKGQFVVNGEPLQIVCGEMHYSRIPPEYWRHRLQMARAMGLNTVGTYVFWNVHEPESGIYDFSGAQDVASFVRTAQEEGLYVILRPGPYACAEWDFGGFPAWLAADETVVLRSRDERFMQPARRFLKRLGRELVDLQNDRGGPIIMVQIENEYGSFGDDRAYMQEIHQALIDAGFTGALPRTEDGVAEAPNGSLPGILIGGSMGDVRKDFAALAKLRPGFPLFAGEYYPGWFDHWGEVHHEVPGRDSAGDIEWMLAQGASMSMYVFHGGTTFGFMNGANYSDDAPYQPQTTSYDYDAPVSEGGAAAPKFHLFREIIVKHTGRSTPPVPPVPARIEIAEFSLTQSADWRDLLGAPVHDQRPRHMEAYGQSYGSILYRAHLTGPVDGELTFGDVRDYATIVIDGKIVGQLDRRLGERSIAIKTPASGATLEVLVENGGRLNFGKRFIHDIKGVIGPVRVGESEILGWDAFPLPMTDLRALAFSAKDVEGPAFHRGGFVLERVGDTFLDTRMLGKGNLWVNGRNAGRFWSIGPQFALYVPASWLRLGENEVIVYDQHDREVRNLSGRTTPLFAPISS
jgi:beta-galactosidase